MIPNFFKKQPIPEKLPTEMEKIIQVLKATTSQEGCLRLAHETLISKYYGSRLKTYGRIYEIFETDVERLWSKSGFLHCHVLNYLLRILLIKSGWFSDDDIKLKYSLVWYISPHQYLQIKTKENKVINVDIWSYIYGNKLGDYARGFH